MYKYSLMATSHLSIRVGQNRKHVLYNLNAGSNVPILGNPGAASREDVIFLAEQYFRVKVYLKCGRALRA